MRWSVLLLMFWSGLSIIIATAQTTVNLLPTKAQGAWECAYYLLNYNEELAQIEPTEWADRCADEADWLFGYGPFSNSDDQFLCTRWVSEVQPLLIRRHFTLSADDVSALAQGTVTLICSYDENPHFYLNGTSLCSFAGWNDDEYASRPLTPRQKMLLREGDNVLAVSLMQGSGGGHIDYGLMLTNSTEANSVKTAVSEDLDNTAYSLGGVLISNKYKHNGFYIKKRQKTFIKESQ